jgi:hypothetical protein
MPCECQTLQQCSYKHPCKWKGDDSNVNVNMFQFHHEWIKTGMPMGLGISKYRVLTEENLGEISAGLEYYGHLAQETGFQVSFSVNTNFYKGDRHECVCKWAHSQHMVWSRQVLFVIWQPTGFLVLITVLTFLARLMVGKSIQVVCLGSLAICSTLCDDHIVHENCQTS